MLMLKVFSKDGSSSQEIEVKNELFGCKYNEALIHQSLMRQLSNKRRSTASTKTRAEVRGGGKKPWKQKGTGRARHGSNRSPIWRGGGITFGPTPERNYTQKLNAKMKNAAIRSGLSKMFKEEKIVVIEKINIEIPKTKDMITLFNNLKISGKILLILKEKNFEIEKSVSNLKNVKSITKDSLNIFDILNSDFIVFEKDTMNEIEGVILK